MTKKKTRFCDLEPDFPDKAFMVLIFLMPIDQSGNLIYPLEPIFKSLDEAAKSAQEWARNFEKEGIEVPKFSVLIPIELESLFPLKKEYWEAEPTLHLKLENRIMPFIRILGHTGMHKLLVTPTCYRNKKWYFRAAIPVGFLATNKDLAKLMTESDLHVDYRAKRVGLYTFGESLRFNWETKKLSNPEDDTGEFSKLPN